MTGQVLKDNKLAYFGICTFVVAVSTYYINEFVVSADVMVETYSDQLSIDQINNLIRTNQRFSWAVYLLIPFVLLLRISYSSFCLFIGSIFRPEFGGFKTFFNATLKAEIIFCVLILVKIFFLEFVLDIRTLNDLNFIPFSLQHLFLHSSIPNWFSYPLQLINVFELTYVLILARLIAADRQLSFGKTLRFAAGSYLIGLLLWALTVVYLTLVIS